MRTPSCELWRSPVKSGEVWRTLANPIQHLPGAPLTFTRVPGKVPGIHQSSAELSGVIRANRFARLCANRVILRESETTIKIKFALFRGGWAGRQGGKLSKTLFFLGNVIHDNKILKVKMLLSRNFVVMAQAPRFARTRNSSDSGEAA